MTTPKRMDSAAELGRLEDALVDSILAASEEELRAEIAQAGEDPDAILRRMDILVAAVKADCQLTRLRLAQEQVLEFQRTQVVATTKGQAIARARFDAARSRDAMLSQTFLLAARNGRGASERDLDSLAEDYAELERLEQEGGIPS
jgi:hypothetical protein